MGLAVHQTVEQAFQSNKDMRLSWKDMPSRLRGSDYFALWQTKGQDIVFKKPKYLSCEKGNP